MSQHKSSSIKPKPNITTAHQMMYNNQRDMVVTGFIRELKSLWTINVIIPEDIIELCILFFERTRKKFVYFQDGWPVSVSYIVDIEQNHISNMFEYSPSNTLNNINFSRFCYIENISQYLNTINTKKLYHGIIGIESHFQKKSIAYPVIFVYESNTKDNNTIKYFQYISSEVNNFVGGKLLFCGKHNGIIYEKLRDLYQFKLANLDLDKKDFMFDKIKTSAVWKTSLDKFGSGKYDRLTLVYLSNHNKLFAVSNDYPYQHETNACRECKIFDFEKCEWMDIADFVCKNRQYCRPSLCYNEYTQNSIYLIGNKGEIAEYNIADNTWIYLKVENSIKLTGNYSYFGSWMDNKQILGCSNGHFFGFID
eukprot:416786_1